MKMKKKEKEKEIEAKIKAEKKVEKEEKKEIEKEKGKERVDIKEDPNQELIQVQALILIDIDHAQDLIIEMEVKILECKEKIREKKLL